MAIRRPFFVVPEPLMNITTGNAVDGRPATNLARHDALGLVWQSNGNSNVFARGQFADGVRPIEFVSLIGANAQPGTTIRVRLGGSQAAVDGGAPYDSGAQTFISPVITRKDGIYHSHLELPSVQNALWWRIDIGGHSGDFAGSMLVAGKKVESAKFYDWEFEFGTDDVGKAEINRFGVISTEAGVILRTQDMTLSWISVTEFENSFRPMMETVGTTRPVFLCFDPQPTTYRQARTYFGLFGKAPFARGKRKPETFGGDFRIRSII